MENIFPIPSLLYINTFGSNLFFFFWIKSFFKLTAKNNFQNKHTENSIPDSVLCKDYFYDELIKFLHFRNKDYKILISSKQIYKVKRNVKKSKIETPFHPDAAKPNLRKYLLFRLFSINKILSFLQITNWLFFPLRFEL